MKKLLFVFVLLAAFALTACSGGPTDFGWVKYQVPEGYTQVNDLVQCATISVSADTDPLNYKLDEKTIRITPKVREGAWPDAKRGLEMHAPDAKLESAEIGGLTYYVTTFRTKEPNDSVMDYADITDTRCIGFVAYYMGFDDPDLQTVLSTIEVNEAKLP